MHRLADTGNGIIRRDPLSCIAHSNTVAGVEDHAMMVGAGWSYSIILIANQDNDRDLSFQL